MTNASTIIRLFLFFSISLIAISTTYTGNAAAGEMIDCMNLLRIDRVRAAMLKSWKEASYGHWKNECGFAVLKDGNDLFTLYSGTNHDRLRTKITVTANTVALFHTHPNSASAEPSLADIDTARKINKPVCTITSRGVYCFYPDRDRTVKLRDYPDWLEN